MPVFDMVERLVMKRFNLPPGIALRLVTRSAYVGEIYYFFGVKLTCIFHLSQVCYCLTLDSVTR